MTYAETSQLFVLMQMTWPHFLRDEAGPLEAQVKWWAGCLDDIAADDAYEAARRLAKSLKWPPHISELREEVERVRRCRKWAAFEQREAEREQKRLEEGS